MNDNTERLERLAARVTYPEAWVPERGDTLTGQAVRWETVERNDRACEVLIVRDGEDVERSVWTWHAQLRYRLIAPKEELADVLAGRGPRLVEPGDFVAISFAGTTPMDSGHDAYRYRVAIDKAAEPADEIPRFPEPDPDADIPF